MSEERKSSPTDARVALALTIRSNLRDAWRQGRYGCGELDMYWAAKRIGEAINEYRDALVQYRQTACDPAPGAVVRVTSYDPTEDR